MNSTGRIRVWDLPTRVFHWSTAALFFLAFVSSDAVTIHALFGYMILLLVFFRLGWGIVGTRYARFDQFVKGPGTVSVYMAKLLAFRPPHSVGHNPMGGWMILALLFFLFLTAFSGLYMSEDGFYGPLYGGALTGLMDEAHEGIASFLMFLVVVHVGGVIVDWLMTGDNIIRAMINGFKDARVAEGRPAADVAIEEGPGVATRAIIIFALALVLTFALVG